MPRLRFPGFEGEWLEHNLEDCLSVCCKRNKGRFTKEEVLSVSGEFGIVNQIAFQGRSFAGESIVNYKTISPGLIVYTKSPLREAPYGIVKASRATNGIVSPLYGVYSANDGINACFIEAYFANALRRNRYFKPLVNLGPKHTMCISDDGALGGSIVIPKKDEQDKICELLDVLDSRITVQRHLVELLKKHKRGLHSAIFGQKCRVVNADGKPWSAWRQVRIGDIFQERSERGGTADELLSVTINNGVKRQADTDKKDSSSEDKSNYKKVLPGDIVYNTMRMWQGASGVSPWAGIVSPAYTVIYPRGQQNTTFWAYAFKYWRLIQEFQKFSQGLTSDTWNLKYPQLSDIRVYEPSMGEQEAIVDILSMLDERVSAAEQELNKMRNLKSGLLQQLFV